MIDKRASQRLPGTVRMLQCVVVGLLLLIGTPIVAQTPMTILVWPKSNKDVEVGRQLETLAHHVAKAVADASPARFVARHASDPQQLSAAIVQAQELLRVDKTGRRAPELLELATGAYQLARNGLETVALADLAEVFRLMGVASYLTGQEALARDYATAYFNLFSEGTDANWAEFPQVQSLALTVQTELRTRSPGSLRLDTTPSGAAVEIDGTGRGVTPLTIDLSPGLHWVRFSLDGYYPKAWIAEARSGETTELKLTIQSHPSRTRYEAATETMRKSILNDKANADVDGAFRDICELAQAKAVLAMVVEGQEGKYLVRGVFMGESGNMSRFDKVLVKDASVLTEFSALMTTVMGTR